ncbi:MAG: aldehyde ferredoxin oxidoreductase family protein [Candidatus Brockarchaeota archaeon]|nr:aldehyde ferredoxin oxidoreductase family protein [Candidatus Brockarchaeota archaeon]
MKGYAGKYLLVNLTSRKIVSKMLDEGMAVNFIGGYGFGARTLYDYVPAGVEPFSPDNVLAFWTGPLAGTIAPVSSKYAVFARSPLTGFFGFGISSGGFAFELKCAQWDGIIFTGRSDSPTYLFIDDENVELRDASHLWGRTTWETEQMIREELGDDTVRVAAIGPAGERLVRIGNITNDRNRQVGRTGMGAVMGSKNLKAVAVRGTRDVEVADPDGLMKFSMELNERLQGPKTEKYRVYGTPANILIHNKLGCLPSYNFQRGTFEYAEEVSGERMLKTHVRKIIACTNCAIACDHVNEVREGPYAGTVASMDYESLNMLGPCCGVRDLNAITKAVEICDTLGVDTISAGVIIAWAMECYEKGILSSEEVDGLDLRFGNSEAMLEALKKLCLREGKLGNLLAEGVKRASEIVGRGSEKFAIHCKGLEWGAYSMRSLKTSTLGFAVSIRGADYLRSGSYQVDVRGEVDRLKLDYSRGKIVCDGENLYAIIDSLIICKFARGIFSSVDELAKLYTLTTGIEMTGKQLLLAGERIHNLAKCFNIRHGASRKDDYPPPRAFEEEMPDDVVRGAKITREEYDEALNGYYDARGWTREGIPTAEKLLQLGLEKEAEEIAKYQVSHELKLTGAK